MKNISTELKVGISVLVATAILLLGIIWAKDYMVGEKRVAYTVIFSNVGNLEIGDPVDVMGVKKGQVDDIRLDGDRVLVTFKLTNDISLRKNARIKIMNLGLMGERFVGIEPGDSSEKLDPSSPCQGYYDTGISEIMGSAGEAVGHLKQLVAAMDSTFGTPQAAASMRQIIANLQDISHDWQTLTAQNKAKMGRAINDLANSSSQIKDMLDGNREKLENTLDNVREGSEHFLQVTNKLDSLSNSAHDLLSGLSDGHGTLGRAMQNDSLYDQLLSTTTSLDSLIADFKRNPHKYVKLSIF